MQELEGSEPNSTAPSELGPDLFLLYNEREKVIDEIAKELERRGLKVYFFRRDVDVGQTIDDIETRMLREARAVAVFLGEQGWGPNHRRLVDEARSLGKLLLPVLIGAPPTGALDEVDGLFRGQRWADLTHQSREDYALLVASVERAAAQTAGPRFDQILKVLVDGTDSERADALDRLIRDRPADAQALSARVRERIRQDFAPGEERRFATAVRDPKRISSVRSWLISVLIWLDAENKESIELFRQHIDPSFELDRNVRFWCLGGLVQRKVSYLPDMIGFALKDPEPEVRGLAEIAGRPNDDRVIYGFRESLASPEFEIAWHVLRILRIVPIPALARDVCAQLGRKANEKLLTYDALFALASRPMAEAAAPILLESPGLAIVVAMVLNEARAAPPLSLRQFSRVLEVFDSAQVQSAINAAAASYEDREVGRQLLALIDEMADADADAAPFIAGYSSDTIDVTNDDIGITRDVRTLASVMLARSVIPPLAIGLFGSWGSGKSFFMRSIEAMASAIATRARTRRQDAFCWNIVQINFNAWHYSDANLWASLVSHILDKLSAHVSPGVTAAEQQAAWQAQLASARADIAAAEADTKRAREHLSDVQRSLENHRLQREHQEVRLRDLRASDLADLLASDKALEDQVRGALNRVGAPAALESIHELNKVVEQSYSVAGRAAALVVGLVKNTNRVTVIACLALLLGGPPLIGWLVLHYVDQTLSTLSAVSAEIVLLAGTATKLIGDALGYARVGLDALSQAKRRVDEALAKKRENPSEQEKQLTEELAASQASEEAAAGRLAAASSRAVELEGRVAALKESQSLGYFLAERTRSDDYKRHLGLISVIRKDFDGLVSRLGEPAADGQPKVERIILYIDDLDRCPPKMVVEVLQAVHLLLAYPLFVVVVSVDPRWLLRSLEDSFSPLKPVRAGDGEVWEATPQDYLEKIFQIPFSVRPMNDTGFSRLIRRLLAPAAAPRPADGKQSGTVPATPTEPGGTGEVEQRPDARPELPKGPDDADSAAPDPGLSQSAVVPEELEELAEAIAISDAEAAFAERLRGFIPTPRAAKRFANIYRLLKASIARNRLGRHEGTRAVPGEFQVPMLLLALLVGHPKASAELFPEWLRNARSGAPRVWASQPRKDEGGEILRVRRDVEAFVQDPFFPRSAALVSDWLPAVARYSFTTAGLYIEAQSVEPDEASRAAARPGTKES